MKKFITPVVSFVQKQSKRNKIIAAGVLVALLIPAVAFASKSDTPKSSKPPVQVQAPQQQEASVAAAVTETQPMAEAKSAPTISQPTAAASTKPSAKATPNTGDENKQHPTPGTGTLTVRPLNVSQSSFQLHAGQTSGIITANGSGTSIGNVNLDYSESTPGLENHISIAYDGPFIPGWATTQSFKFVALPSATPGTYTVRLTVATEHETMNSKNPVFYRTTVTVIILP